MLKLNSMERQITQLRGEVFAPVAASEDELAKMHEDITELSKGIDKRLAVRLEIFIMLLLLQPEVLFKKMKFTDSVVRYCKIYMRLRIANMSKYKCNLIFLYFNDVEFRKSADLVLYLYFLKNEG